MKTPATIFAAFFLLTASSGAAEFYKISRISYLTKEPRKGLSVYDEIPVHDANGRRTNKVEKIFVPCLEVEVSAAEQVKAVSTFARAYFYDGGGKLIASLKKPTPIDRGSHGRYGTPAIYAKQKTESIFFKLPKEVLESNTAWTALMVFGDQHGADADTYPSGKSILSFDFPEKEQYNSRKAPVERKAFMDPVVEHVVKTGNSVQPQITLFLRPPIGMTDASEAQGVLAMCLLADSVGDIKRRLQSADAQDDVGSVLRFAQKHKLLILCWGSRGIWDPSKNWDDLSKQSQKKIDENFDDVAKAWGRGVNELSRRYGIPQRDFLMWGSSGAAQYAARLALRKPEYFLAVSIHIPSSFDKPTPEANRVLWCLTTGEIESGYERSLRFYDACRELGYPIIYKAIIGLGHQWHPTADRLGLQFFEFALAHQEEKANFEAELEDRFSSVAREWKDNPLRPWPESFRNPPFVGDAVNQEMFPIEKGDMVPNAFRVPLPTQQLAETWNRK